MKKFLLMVLCMIMLPFTIKAEDIKVDWQKSWGGNKTETFGNIFKTKDEGIIVSGTFESTDIEGLDNKGNTDVFILKYDKDGNILWQKSWGGSDSEGLTNVIETVDREIIIIGSYLSNDIEGLPCEDSYDAMILKYDKDGNLLWQKSYKKPKESHPNNVEHTGATYFNDVIQTNDKGFVVIGKDSVIQRGEKYDRHYTNAFILKYDKDGNILWEKSFEGEGLTSISQVTETNDGSLIAIGNFFTNELNGIINKGATDGIIIKYDKDGNLLWQKSWGGNNDDYLEKMFLAENDGFRIISSFASDDIDGLENKGEIDIAMLMYDKDGNLLWQKSWGTEIDELWLDSVQTSDGGFVSIGSVPEPDWDYDALIVKHDKDGNVVWSKIYGGSTWDDTYDVIPTKDGGFVTSIYFDSTDIEGVENKGNYDAIIHRYDKNGNVLWQKTFGGNDWDELTEVIYTENYEIFALGIFDSTDIDGLENKGESDIVMIKYSLDYDYSINEQLTNGSATIENLGNYVMVKPNPNEGFEVDKLIVNDTHKKILGLEPIKQEDNSYLIELYTDINVDVIFKEKIENPKTGILDIITIIFIGFAISISGFFIVKRYNERLEF